MGAGKTWALDLHLMPKLALKTHEFSDRFNAMISVELRAADGVRRRNNVAVHLYMTVDMLSCFRSHLRSRPLGVEKRWHDIS